jgi:hypothetical protein
MKRPLSVLGEPVRRGKKMTAGDGWKLVVGNRRARGFPASLIKTINVGKYRLAIFSVPK